ncbi:MAG TPA: hypothetical protein VNZ24_13180 [Vicinamibacterales bacterium]|nr:hypothetical protein [Vicinamibacterales bacterium]
MKSSGTPSSDIRSSKCSVNSIGTVVTYQTCVVTATQERPVFTGVASTPP